MLKASQIIRLLCWLSERLAGMLVDGFIQQLIYKINPFVTLEVAAWLIAGAMVIWATYRIAVYTITHSVKIPQIPPRTEIRETYSESSKSAEVRVDGSVVTAQTTKPYTRSVSTH